MHKLEKAERYLRRDDKAIRLRWSMQQPYTILLERKTFVGRIGALLPNREVYLPDSGYRREWGHVHVATIPVESFFPMLLREALQQSDTWKWERSLADVT